MNNRNLTKDIEALRRLLLAKESSSREDSKHYSELRAAVLSNSDSQVSFSSIVGPYPTLKRCRAALAEEFPNPKNLCDFINLAFDNISAKISNLIDPAEAQISAALDGFDERNVYRTWRKALERCYRGDLDGAI